MTSAVTPGFERPWSVAAAAAGVVGAVAFTLSPLTVLALLVTPLLVWAVSRNLPQMERRVVWLVFGVAVAVRVALIAALFLSAEHDSQSAAILVPDEAYTISRTLRIRNVLLGIPALKYDYGIAFEDYGRTSFLWVMTGAQLLFGPSPYGMRLVNAMFFLAGAILLFRLARQSFGPLPGLLGFALLLFLPTWLFWSVTLLKESLYFLLAALALSAVVGCVRAIGLVGRVGPIGQVQQASRHHRWAKPVLLAVVAAAAVVALRDLRTGAVALVLSSLALGGALYLLTATARRVALGSIVIAVAAAFVLTRPAEQARIVRGVEDAARNHVKHVITVGHSYKLLDEAFYATLNLEPSLTPSEAARFAVRAVVSFVLVPLPGQVATRGELLQLPEHLLWYVLVVLAPFGIVAGLKRDPLVTWLLVGYMLPTATIVALTNGNVGTLIRFRGLITPYLVWLSCLGFCVIMQRLVASARAETANPCLSAVRVTTSDECD